MLHWLLQWDCCCCLSNLLTSDLNSSASWVVSFEDAYSTTERYASMGGIWGNCKVGSFL